MTCIHKDLIAYGRGLASQALPYWTQTIYGMVPVMTTAIPTMAVTEKLNMYYNPHFLDALQDPRAMIGFCIAHEAAHLCLRHISRGKRVADQELYSIAGDLAINPMLAKVPRLAAPLWKSGKRVVLLPSDYGFPDGLSTDQYYELLLKQPKKKKKKKDDEGDEEGGEPGEGQHGVTCGSCLTELDPELKKKLEELEGKNTGARSQIEVDAIEAVTDQAVRQAARSTLVGHLPGLLNEQLEIIGPEEEATAAQIRWDSVFKTTLYSSVSEVRSMLRRRSYQRISRRSYVMRTIRPSSIERGGIVPAIVLDTSGSMSNDDIRKCIIQAVRIMRTVGIRRAWWLEADTRVSNTPKMINLSEMRSINKVTGRGGTDFRPAVAALEKLRPQPNLFVYFTDGYGQAPDVPPPRTVSIWAVINKGPKPASWGRYVPIDGPLEDDE